MKKDGGRRIATANGAILAEDADLGGLLDSAGESLFDPLFWSGRAGLSAVSGGRGAAWFLTCGNHHWVLRHYRRGGLITRISQDRYFWAGESQVRAFAEYRLLETLTSRGLPVPKPIAARYRRSGLVYRCDILVQRIADARAFSAVLESAALGEESWRAVGATVARLHRAGVDHADLNAHNILLGGEPGVSVIDFDRGRLRSPGGWAKGNLRRLRRSLDKLSKSLPPDRVTDGAWSSLLAGYEAECRA